MKSLNCCCYGTAVELFASVDVSPPFSQTLGPGMLKSYMGFSYKMAFGVTGLNFC